MTYTIFCLLILKMLLIKFGKDCILRIVPLGLTFKSLTLFKSISLFPASRILYFNPGISDYYHALENYTVYSLILFSAMPINLQYVLQYSFIHGCD